MNFFGIYIFISGSYLVKALSLGWVLNPLFVQPKASLNEEGDLVRIYELLQREQEYLPTAAFFFAFIFFDCTEGELYIRSGQEVNPVFTVDRCIWCQALRAHHHDWLLLRQANDLLALIDHVELAPHWFPTS